MSLLARYVVHAYHPSTGEAKTDGEAGLAYAVSSRTAKATVLKEKEINKTSE